MSIRMIPLRPTALALGLFAVLHGAPARAADTDVPAAPAVDADGSVGKAKTLDTVSVIGQGQSRQVQRITTEDVKILPPGSSPLKVLQGKPGVHFESADPFGNYEWSTRISLRGFNQNRLGFTLDGIRSAT